MELTQQRWGEEFFLKEVSRHLDEWPTGRELDLAEIIEYHKAMPEGRIFVKSALKAREEGRTLLGVVTGKPVPDEQVEELRYVEPAVDYFQIVADSLTRSCRFKEAELGLQQSLDKGKNIINGFPFVIHGLKTSREVLESVSCPVQSPYPISNSQLSGIMAVAAGAAGMGVAVFGSDYHGPQNDGHWLRGSLPDLVATVNPQTVYRYLYPGALAHGLPCGGDGNVWACLVAQPNELCDDMFRTSGAPFALVEDGNVAEHARPRTAPRCLHRRIAFEG